MSEESLGHSAKTVEEARKKVDETPIMPFEGDAPPETPDESAGAVAEHGEQPVDDADRPVDPFGDDHAPEDADRGSISTRTASEVAVTTPTGNVGSLSWVDPTDLRAADPNAETERLGRAAADAVRATGRDIAFRQTTLGAWAHSVLRPALDAA